MIDHDAIRRGIRSIILAVPGLPTERAWENREFKPPNGEAWVRETLLPGMERQVASQTIQSVGVYQLDLFWPAGKGTEDPDNLADLIKDSFKPATGVAANATVYRAERFPGSDDDAKWYHIPVRLSWRAYSFG